MQFFVRLTSFVLGLALVCNVLDAQVYKYPCNGPLLSLTGGDGCLETEWPNLIHNSITICAWVRCEVTLPAATPMGIYYRAINGATYPYADCRYGLVINSAGEFAFVGKFTTGDPGGTIGTIDSVSSGFVPVKGTFYHVAASFDQQSMECKIYVNGVVKGSKTMPGVLNYPYGVNYKSSTIGAFSSFYSSLYSYNYFKGYIDEVFISTRALGQTEIDTVALQTLTTDQYKRYNTGAHWKLNEGSGNFTTTAYYPLPQSQTGFGQYADFIGAAAWISCSSNKAPVANAGPDQVIYLPATTATLTGKGSDPDGSITSYNWSKVSGPAGGNISVGSDSITTAVSLQEGTYVFKLTVTDNKGATGDDSVSIEVRKNGSIIDPYPSLIKSDGTIDLAPAHFASARLATGAACDGLTKLLLVCNSTVPVEFSLNNPKDGFFSTDQKTFVNTPVVVQPDVSGQVVIVYKAPDGYGADNMLYPLTGRSRAISINATMQPNGQVLPFSFKLVTPPVVLVHGMWSSPEVWAGFMDYLRINGFPEPSLADYSKYNAETFDPGLKNNPARDMVFKAIVNALLDYRNKGIAATQVDAIGHSNGGMITRGLSVQSSLFNNPENYNKGYLHKLITFGTPHGGAPIGPYLWENRNKIVYLTAGNASTVPGTTPTTIPIKIADLLKSQNMPVGQCHPDFGKGSAALGRLSATPGFYTFAVIGDYFKNGSRSVESYGFGTSAYWTTDALFKVLGGKTHKEVYRSPCTPSTLEIENDLFVGVQSQTGGITRNKIFTETGHSIPASNTESNNPLIHQFATGLLLSDKATDFSIGFPAPASISQDCNNGRQANLANGASNQINMQANVADNSQNRAVILTGPNKNTVFSSSSNLVTLEYTTAGITVPSAAVFIVKNIGWFAAPDIPPYKVSFELPKNYPAGQIDFAVLVLDTSGIVLADTSHITTTTSGVLNSIKTIPASVTIDSLNNQSNVYVLGQYINGNDTAWVNITPAAAGTTYLPEQGNTVFDADINGNITGVHPGTDSLIINNSGKQIKIPVVVADHFNARQLYPNIIEFDSIPDKEVNDLPFALSAQVTSATDVVFSPLSGPIKVDNGVVTILQAGRATVRASATGDNFFNNAPDVTRSFCINPRQPGYITGDTITCASEKTYAFKQDTTVSYNWAVTGGSIARQTRDSITVQWTGSGAQTLKVAPTVGGCTGKERSITVTITAPPVSPTISASGNTNFCVGGDVQLTASIAGNLYQWFNGGTAIAGATGQQYTASASGSYTVRVGNGSCGVVSPPMNITALPAPSKPVLTAAGNTTFCAGGNLALNSSFNGSSQWYRNDTLQLTTAAGSYTVSQAGRYTVKSSAAGCVSVASDPVIITVETASGTISSPVTAICPGKPVTLTASGGASYQWYFEGAAVTGAVQQDYNVTQPGLYSADIITAHNCRGKAGNTIKLTPLAKPVAGFTFDAYCINEPVNFKNTTADTGRINYSWSFGDNSFSTDREPQHTYRQNGVFTIRLIAAGANCAVVADTLQKTITIVPPVAGVQYPTVTLIKGRPQQLSARGIGTAYLWTPATDLSNPAIANPVVTATAERRYLVSITTSSGCKTTDTLPTVFSKQVELFVPTAFTPNSNGMNDLLRPVLVNIPVIKYFRVYNRWGQLVFETYTPNAGWDGTLNGIKQPTETYSWIFEGTDNSGNAIKGSGKTLLIR